MANVSNNNDDMESLNERLSRIEKKLDREVESNESIFRRLALQIPDLLYKREEIDFNAIWVLLWRSKWIIAGITALFAISSVAFSLMLPNIYRSSALLAPSEEAQGGGLSALADQFGGLASIAGLSLQNGNDTKITTAIEVIKSRQFVAYFIDKYDLLVPLMAAKGWDLDANKVLIDEELYDSTRSAWTRDVSPPKQATPSSWEAHEQFVDIVSVARDRISGFVTISVDHYSPYVAKDWAEKIIQEINLVTREQDVKEALQSIDYLQKQMEKTPIADMRSVFYKLIEEQTKTIMLAEVKKGYVFTTIDPPVVPEEKVKPKRALICVLGTMLGFVLGVGVIVIHNSFFRK